jgi:hypothetical protein
MGKAGKAYLWSCAALGAGVMAYIGYQYWRWTVTNFDKQEQQ